MNNSLKLSFKAKDTDAQVIESFFKKHQHLNKSSFIREALLKAIKKAK